MKRGIRLGTAGTTIACAVLAVSMLTAGSVFATAETIVAISNPADPMSPANSFSKAVYTMDQGERPNFRNNDIVQHNATASLNGPDGNVLFSSPTIGTGTTTLNGTQYLTTGGYTFICTIHPTTMIATLAVSANGTPVPRPTLALTVITKDIAKALRAGLRIRLDLGAKSDDLGLEAKLGKTTIGKAEGISEAQGTSFVQLKLNKAGKSKLRDRGKASVTVTGSIPFGSPVTAKGKLKLK